MPHPDAPFVLTIDTAAEQCSAALFSAAGDVGAAPLAARAEPMTRGHAERLFPLIAEILDQVGASYPDISRIAVCVGPGNFTGARIGVSAARGLALALGASAVGVSRFEALAETAIRALDPGEALAAAFAGRRGQIHVQTFIVGPCGPEPLSDPATVEIDPERPDIWRSEINGAGFSSRRLLCAGSGAAAFAAAVGGAARILDGRREIAPAGLAAAAARKGAPGTQVARPRPLYMRPPDAAPPSEAPPKISLRTPPRLPS